MITSTRYENHPLITSRTPASSQQQAVQNFERDLAKVFQGLANLFRDAFSAQQGASGQKPPSSSGSTPDGFDAAPQGASSPAGSNIPRPIFMAPHTSPTSPRGPSTNIPPPNFVAPHTSPTSPQGPSAPLMTIPSPNFIAPHTSPISPRGPITPTGAPSAPTDGNFVAAKPDHFEATHDYSIRQTNVDGRNVYAFTVKDGDVQPWDAHNVGPGGKPNQRAEIGYAAGASDAKRNSPYNVTAQTGKQSYKMSVMFDKNNWPSNSRWATLLQFHPQDSANSNGWGFGGVSVHGNSLNFITPNADGKYIARVPIQPGQWNDLRLDVNWSSKSDGYVKVYDNNKLIGEYHGPTAKDGVYYYLKQGYYRDGATTQTGTVYESPLEISKG